MFIKTLSANVPLEGAWMLGGKKKIMSKRRKRRIIRTVGREKKDLTRSIVSFV